jgi:hypothetical protein
MSEIEDLVEAAEPNPPLARVVKMLCEDGSKRLVTRSERWAEPKIRKIVELSAVPLWSLTSAPNSIPRSSQLKAEFLGPEARGFETASTSIRFNTGKTQF